jgi:hypothetical protein
MFKNTDNYSLEKGRKREAEKHLYELLDKACQALDICLSEWDVDKNLFMAIINSPKSKLNKKRQLFVDYDNSYRLLEKLSIKTPTKYRWFTNISEHTQ